MATSSTLPDIEAQKEAQKPFISAGKISDGKSAKTAIENTKSRNDAFDAVQFASNVHARRSAPKSTVQITKKKEASSVPSTVSEKVSTFVGTIFDLQSVRDYYTVMFLLDIVCIIIIISGYSSFTASGSGAVIEDIKESRVTVPFVSLLSILCLALVIDRGLYLRKAVYCKVVFDAIMFFILNFFVFIFPLIRTQAFRPRGILLGLYVVKCIYFVLSAIQLCKGYPALSMQKFEKRSYGVLSLVFSKMFMGLPFLFELRSSIDWTWTDTSLSFIDFYNMENLYMVIYDLKCKRTWEKNYPPSKGKAQKKLIKYGCGMPIILAIIFIMMLPIVFFAFLNSFGIENKPVDVKLEVGVTGYPPMYTMHAEGDYHLEPLMFEPGNLASKWSNKFTEHAHWEDTVVDTSAACDRLDIKEKSRQAESFIGDYSDKQIFRVRFQPLSLYPWRMSKENLLSLQYELNSTRNMTIKIKLDFLRPRLEKTEPTIRTTTISLVIEQKLRADLNSAVGSILKAMETKNTTEISVTNVTAVFPHSLPMYVIVPFTGELKIALPLLRAANYRNRPIKELNNDLIFKLSIGQPNEYYWTMQHNLSDGISRRKLHFDSEKIQYEETNLTYVEVIAFVDRVFPSYIPPAMVVGGIVGMYFVVVVAFSQIARRVIATTPLDMMINEILNPDRLLNLCQDIYISREVKAFTEEQELYATLISIFRCNAALVEWTETEVAIAD